MPLLDRRMYNNLDGTRMDDAQLYKMFSDIHKTISTGGANDMTPGRFKGRAMLANRNTEARVIHFKDADSQIAYDQKYGSNPLYDKLVNHVNSMSRDIGTMEHLVQILICSLSIG